MRLACEKKPEHEDRIPFPVSDHTKHTLVPAGGHFYCPIISRSIGEYARIPFRKSSHDLLGEWLHSGTAIAMGSCLIAAWTADLPA